MNIFKFDIISLASLSLHSYVINILFQFHLSVIKIRPLMYSTRLRRDCLMKLIRGFYFFLLLVNLRVPRQIYEFKF